MQHQYSTAVYVEAAVPNFSSSLWHEAVNLDYLLELTAQHGAYF